MKELKPGQEVTIGERDFIVLASNQGRAVLQDLSASPLPDLASLTPCLEPVKLNRKERRGIEAEIRRKAKKAKVE